MSFNGYQLSTPPTVHFQQPFLDLETLTPLPATDDLEVAFSRIREEVQEGAHVTFRIVREGQPRRLHPLVWHEAYRIGREALLNAFRHSEGSQVEVELEYSPTRLRLAIRDDGKGIGPELFCTGRGSHRGLSGMRELAERIGAHLKLLSRVAAGTEIELSIPGNIAFASQARDRQLGWAHA